ncbi:MAG TPA: hypothetical protein VF282_08090 [Bacillota bacterium]
MKSARLRRLERIARAHRRAAEVELASARDRLTSARDRERAAETGRRQAVAERQAALAAGIDAGQARNLEAVVEAWRSELAAAARTRREAEVGYEGAHRALVEAHRHQRSLDLLAAGARRREAQEQALREREAADEQALLRFAFDPEGR